jgi:hypothetical protein
MSDSPQRLVPLTKKLFQYRAIDHTSHRLRIIAHLPKMSLRHHVAFVSIFISAGLLAQLTIPSQLCQTFGFDSIANCLRGEKASRLISCFAHCEFSATLGPGWAGSVSCGNSEPKCSTQFGSFLSSCSRPMVSHTLEALMLVANIMALATAVARRFGQVQYVVKYLQKLIPIIYDY